jgi:hypothetical protein
MVSSWESASADVAGNRLAPQAADDHFAEVAAPIEAAN